MGYVQDELGEGDMTVEQKPSYDICQACAQHRQNINVINVKRYYTLVLYCQLASESIC
jgi:hypothetical protein